jgi:periplasmic protein TonB
LQTHTDQAPRPTGASLLPRGLGYALAASCLLHLALLWPTLLPQVRESGSRRMAVVLRPHTAPAALSDPLARTEREFARAAIPEETTRPVPAKSPITLQRMPLPRKQPQAKPLYRPQITERVATRKSPAMSIDATAAGRSDEEQIVDAEGLRAYRLALARNAMQFRTYPAEALGRHESGTARLRVRIADGGSVPGVTLVASSGVDSLDRQAQQMLQQATAVTPVPDSLHGTAFTFELPVEFDPEALQ